MRCRGHCRARASRDRPPPWVSRPRELPPRPTHPRCTGLQRQSASPPDWPIAIDVVSGPSRAWPIGQKRRITMPCPTYPEFLRRRGCLRRHEERPHASEPAAPFADQLSHSGSLNRDSRRSVLSCSVASSTGYHRARALPHGRFAVPASSAFSALLRLTSPSTDNCSVLSTPNRPELRRTVRVTKSCP
jgi:hypothetical protein